jgi:UDP-glucose 4-epimerase
MKGNVGKTKNQLLMVEWLLEDAGRAHGLRYVALRYFNVAGIDPKGRAGQPDRQIPHLIKRAAQVAAGLADHIEVFGTDYPTRDGTGVRDYIHVADLVDAHLLALDYLRTSGASAVFNCGYGTGSSVSEVIAAFELVTGRELARLGGQRRPAMPRSWWLIRRGLRATLGWRPHFDSLDVIVSSALAWERRLSESLGREP